MKRITSREIKKVLYGIILSDGYIGKTGRLDLYNKNIEYIQSILPYINSITRTRCSIYEKMDSRFGSIGYRLTTNSTPYFKKFRDIFYSSDGRKHITKYIVDRLDFQSLAHIWMCDGYLFHAKDYKKQKIQNIGYFCLEGFPEIELLLFINRLKELGIESRLEKVAWGFGFRPKISGKSLQKFIDNIYKHIEPCFKYKTNLYYKSNLYLDSSLQSAEQYVRYYTRIEDIVRHSQ